MGKLLFYNADISLRIDNKRKLRSIVEFLFKNEGYLLDRLNYIFCSDAFLLAINQKYLRHNTLTDVISFKLSEKNQPITGEIYISIPRVKENSKKYQVSLHQELSRVMIHGALHFCGYNDKQKNDKLIMIDRENYYLNILASSKS